MLPGKTYTPNDLFAIARRGRWLIVIPFVLVSAAALLVVRALPDHYRSETLVLVVPQRVPESYVQSTVTTHIQDRLQSIAQQILSRTELERIITQFNLYPERRRAWIMEDVVELMRRDISLQVVKGDAFRISYSYRDPVTAMRVTERLASLFIEENLRNRAILADDTSAFLETQLEDARRRLQTQETRLAEYRRQHAGELPSQAESNLQATQATQQQLQALAEGINRDEDRQMVLQQAIAEQSGPSSSPAPAADGSLPATAAAADQLEAAKNTLKALETRLTPSHPDVIHMRRVVSELEQKVRQEQAGAAGAGVLTPQARARKRQIEQLTLALDAVQRELRFKRSEVERLKKSLATYQARLEAMPTRESDLATLTRDYSTLQDIYRNLLTKREDAQIAANLERRQIGEQFRILDPANRPEKPFSPNRPLLNLLGALSGLGLGIGLVALREYRDEALRTETDATNVLALPVLATIPVMVNPADRRRRRRRYVLWTLLAGTPIAIGVIVVLWHFMPLR